MRSGKQRQRIRHHGVIPCNLVLASDATATLLVTGIICWRPGSLVNWWLLILLSIPMYRWDDKRMEMEHSPLDDGLCRGFRLSVLQTKRKAFQDNWLTTVLASIHRWGVLENACIFKITQIWTTTWIHSEERATRNTKLAALQVHLSLTERCKWLTQN